MLLRRALPATRQSVAPSFPIYEVGSNICPRDNDSFRKFSGAYPEEAGQQTARSQDYAGTDPGAVLHESARRPINRLSAPVSARRLLPKKLQPEILDFVTQKTSADV
jgi:hypothetical protein